MPGQPRPPTLRDLLCAPFPNWIWAECRCGHSAAVPLVPFVIRLGFNTTVAYFLAALSCRECGRRGARMRQPSWDVEAGSEPFPIVAAMRPFETHRPMRILPDAAE